MHRFFNLALSAIGFTVAAPFAIGIVIVVSMLLLLVCALLVVGVATIAGEFVATLCVLAVLVTIGYFIYTYIVDAIITKHVERALPHLNAYKELIARYDPDTLPEPHRTNIAYDQQKFARIFQARTRPDLVPQNADDRAILQRLTFTRWHLSGITMADLKAMLSLIPDDLDTFATILAFGRAETARAEQHTVIGETFATTPRLFHEPPDPVVSIPFRDRFKHGYIIGKTGAGKSNLLKHLITQDFGNDDAGLILLSPEDGIFQALLPAIPEHRRDDLIYFDPTDTIDPVIGFNPFDFTEADAMPQYERDAYLTLKAGETYTIFERALGDLGVKMTTLMQNIAYALLQVPNATLLDLDSLLNPHENEYRQTISHGETLDPRTRQFWKHYDRSTYYKSTYDPVINRLDPFLRPPLSKVLATPALSFHEAINGGKPRILFCNLSKLRGEQAAILGQLIIATIQQTLLRREQIPETQRIPYFFYIDEFAVFTTSEQSFVDLFERARKYRCGVTLAHQVMADLPSKLLDVIVGNVATMLVMQLGAGDAPYFAKELQLVEYDQLKADSLIERETQRLQREAERTERVTGIRPVNPLRDPNERAAFMARVRAQSEGSNASSILQNLPTGKAIAKVPSFNYGMPVTIPFVRDPYGSINAELIARSKQNYGKSAQPVLEPVPTVEGIEPPELIPPKSVKRTRKKKAAAPDDGERLFKIKVQ